LSKISDSQEQLGNCAGDVAQTGEWKGARNRTFRAGHRPWTGGWPGTPWNLPGQQLTARARGHSLKGCVPTPLSTPMTVDSKKKVLPLLRIIVLLRKFYKYL